MATKHLLQQAHYVACIKRDKAAHGLTVGSWTKPDPKQWQQLWRKA
jgi:hypothetical protein